MTFILVDDEKRCNFCVYWPGMRKKDESFVYVDFDSAEWGICLCKKLYYAANRWLPVKAAQIAIT